MEKEVPGITSKEIIDILDGFTEQVDEKEGDLTQAKAALHWNVSVATANRRLQLLVEEGKLTRFKGKLSSGNWGFIYRAS
jgi:Fic family protein